MAQPTTQAQSAQRRRRLRPWLIAGLTLVLSLGTLGVYRYFSADSAKGPTNLYAYVSANALVVMSGTSEVMRYEAAFNPTSSLAWTFDGRYIAGIVVGDPSSEALADRHNALVAIDVVSRSVRTSRCPECRGVAAVGDSTVMAIAHPLGTLWRFDLASDESPVKLQSDLPQLFVGPEVLSGIPGAVLIAGSSTPGGGNRGSADELFLVGADGRASRVDTAELEWDRIHGAIAAPSSGLFVVNVSTSTSYCAYVSETFLVEVRISEVTRTDVSEITPYGYSSDAGTMVEAALSLQSSWWVGERLYGTFEAWTCHRGEYIPGQEIEDELATITPSSVWRLEDRRWVHDPGKIPGTLFELDTGATVLVDPEVQSTGPGRPLFVEHDGSRTTVAQAIFVVAAPPS